MFAGTPVAGSNVTLWFPVMFQVTVPLSAMSTDDGLNEFPGVVTVALDGNTGAVTVIVTSSVTFTEPDVAVTVIVTAPAATPVTSPAADTVARAVLELDQASVALKVAPNWSRAVAESCSVAPAATVVAGAEIETLLSAGGADETVTVRAAVTVTEPDVACALITALPAATPVTTPVDDTVATDVAPDDHVTVAAIAAPFWSSVVADSCSVAPVCTLAVAGEICTDVSTGAPACTVTVAVPKTDVAPAVAVAVMVADPGATPVTSPVADTVATDGADDAHDTLAANALPFWSRGVAESCSVWPAVIVPPPVTDTDASAGAADTVTTKLPVTERDASVAVAVIVALPGPTAETSPAAVTVATVASDDDQVTVACTLFPDWSRALALSCTVWPTTRADDPPPVGVTATDVNTAVGADGPVGPGPAESPPPPAQAAPAARKPQAVVRRTNLVSVASPNCPARPASPALQARHMTRYLLLAAALVPALASAQRPLALARPDAEFSEPFTNITGIRELRDGRVIVSDARDKTLQLIDLRSGAAQAISREGQGPGEYGIPFRLLPMPGDSTALYDIGNSRYLMIHPDGKAGRDFRLEAAPARGAVAGEAGRGEAGRGGGGRMMVGGRGGMVMGLTPPRGWDARGNVYYEGQALTFNADGMPTPADSVPVMRFDRGANRADTAAWVRPAKSNAQVTGGRGNMNVMIGGANPLAPRDDWAVMPDGRVAVLRSPEYRMDLYGPGRAFRAGQPVTYERIRVDNAVKQETDELRRRQAAGGIRMTVTDDGRGAPQRAVTVGGGGPALQLPPLTDWPEFVPPFLASAAVARPNGEVWVLRTRKPGDKIPTYDVFDATGRVIGRVALPADTRLIGFGNGTVYLVRSDADDLQYLQRYRLAMDAKLVG